MTENPFLMSIARHVASKGAGILVAHGAMTSQDSEQFIGLAVFVLSLLWSWFEKRRNRPPGSGPSTTTALLVTLALVCSFASGGCARFDSTQTKFTSDGARTESRTCLTTFLASKATVTKLRASVTATSQGVTVGSIDSESNASDLVEAAVRGAVQGLKK